MLFDQCGAITEHALLGIRDIGMPLFVLVLFFQRQIVSGLTAGEVKGQGRQGDQHGGASLQGAFLPYLHASNRLNIAA